MLVGGTVRYSFKAEYVEGFKLRNLTENKDFNNKKLGLFLVEGNQAQFTFFKKNSYDVKEENIKKSICVYKEQDFTDS